MRKLPALLALTAGLVTACDPVAVLEQVVPYDTPSGPVDDRIPGGWFLHPDEEGTCGGLAGVGIPCRDVLNVCVEGHDGRMEPKWLITIYRCTNESPTWRDVCRTRPEAEWAFYGYTREECATA